MISIYKKLYKTIFILLLTSSLSYAEETCFSLFDLPSKSPLTHRLSKLANQSPSRLLPIFRTLHTDFVEAGANGLYVLNPTYGKWKVSNERTVQIEQTSSKSSIERAIIFNVIMDSRVTVPLSVRAREQLDSYKVVTDDLLSGATRVRIRVASSDPSQIHYLVLRSNFLKEEIIVLSFQAPELPTDLFVDIPNGVAKLQSNIEVRFQWKTTNTNTFNLSVFGPIIFERGITSSKFDPNRKAILNYFRKNNWEGYSPKFQDKLLGHILKNLSDPKVLDETLEVARQGPEAISKKLAEIDFYIREVELYKKIERTRDFFQSPHRTSLHVLGWAPRVPIEKNEFALEHGSYTHALQLIAMTSGMNRTQVFAFLYGPYRMFFQNRVEGWRAWDILFDAPGDATPHSPLWWRREMEIRDIPFSWPLQ